MNPLVVLESIDFFLTYMYTGSLSAGESTNYLGNAYYCECYLYLDDVDASSYTYVPVTVSMYGTLDDYGVLDGRPFVECSQYRGEFWQNGTVSSYPYVYLATTYDFIYPTRDWGIALFVTGELPFYNESDGYVMIDNYGIPTWRLVSNVLTPAKSSGGYVILGGANSSHKSTKVTNIPNTPTTANSGTVYLPIDPTETYAYDDLIDLIAEELSENYPELEIESDDLPTYDEIMGNTDPTEETGDSGSGNTYNNIYATEYNVEGDVNIDGDVNAFLYGDVDAFAYGDVDAYVAGGVGVVSASGDANISASGDVNVSASGDLNVSASEVIVYQGETVDYDEILSERELESILNQTEYYLEEIGTDEPVIQLDTLPDAVLPAEVSAVSRDIVVASANVLTDTGMMSVYLPIAVVVFLIRVLKGRE